MAEALDPSAPSLAAVALATSAAIFLGTVPLLQMDAVSRLVLSPDRLRAKRRSEQTYRFRKALDVKTAELRSYVQGNEPSAFKYNPKEEELGTDLLTKEEEYDALVGEILDKTKQTPSIVAIDQDPQDERSTREWYLWLAFPPEEGGGGSEEKAKNKWRRVQVPLIPLTQKLADKFEDALSSTALCFVTDASGGLGSEIVGRTAAECGAGAALIKEPAWILSFASLVASNVLSKSKMERALFALCRLDAWRVRDSVGECRTVVFTLPGQSCSPTLIPLLQKAFPHERHVFAYDSCAEAIRRGIALRRGGKRPSAAAAPDGGTGNASVFAEIAVMPQAVTATAPLSPLRTVSKIANALATLPTDHADTAEAWMASIDRVLSMKADEADNGYLPFVCRMGFLMGRTGQLGNGDVDVSELALTNVLQYVTGTRSRPPKAEVLDAAREVLRAMKEECEALVVDVKLTDAQVKAVEDFAFEHKGILIQDKTLLDTVQPKKEWSLKAAKKLTGCACCGPEEEEDEDEAGAGAAGGAGPSNARGIDMSVPGAGAIGLKQRTGASSSSARRSSYVDGKSTFAFDPTKFS